MFYSERRATTGSFLAALLLGIMPANMVSTILSSIKITATSTGSIAFKLGIPVSARIMALMGIHSR